MSNKKTGKITEILEVESGISKKTEKPWKKLTFAIDTNEAFNNIVAFEVFGEDKVDNFLKYNKVGQTVEVDFNISSNKWKDKYFTSASAWKITKANEANDALTEAARVIDTHFEPAGDLTKAEDDLPF